MPIRASGAGDDGGLGSFASPKSSRNDVPDAAKRLAALRDIRTVFDGVGDVRAELTITARYVLAELDSEAHLLRVLTAEARNRPELLRDAAEHLVGSSLDRFADWLTDHSDPPMTSEDAAAFAALSLGGLISNRLLDTMLGLTPKVDDQTLVRAWVTLVAPIVAAAPTAPSHPSRQGNGPE